MSDHKFDQSVSVFVGLGFPREINTVFDAYDLLLEWNGIPDVDYHAALHACGRALNAGGAVRDAHEAFIRFARNRGILSEDALDRAAENVLQDWLVA
ncbi:DUF982 domain-containing protein [Mesorhizobium xinjiangense]|uniref:DUF982 domain-containing protein n=1 Tax=Mesorhizobium xinjiangense TaxID=2678685 RepID=UPI0012EE0F12|nr:DUF982 domain-containing protein [Mesorhizobium xinjiangense]